MPDSDGNPTHAEVMAIINKPKPKAKNKRKPNYNAGLHKSARGSNETYPGSKEDKGGKTSKPAQRSRSMTSPESKAKKDVKAGRYMDMGKTKSKQKKDF